MLNRFGFEMELKIHGWIGWKRFGRLTCCAVAQTPAADARKR